MQKMILIPVERYSRMIESYDRAIEELQEVRQQIKAMIPQEDEVSREQ